MPSEVLYGMISFLGLVVIALGGLWVKSHDAHRQWATTRINEQDRLLAVLQTNHTQLTGDIAEIKSMIERHLEKEENYQRLMLRKFNVDDKP